MIPRTSRPLLMSPEFLPLLPCRRSSTQSSICTCFLRRPRCHGLTVSLRTLDARGSTRVRLLLGAAQPQTTLARSRIVCRLFSRLWRIKLQTRCSQCWSCRQLLFTWSSNHCRRFPRFPPALATSSILPSALRTFQVCGFFQRYTLLHSSLSV